MADTILKAKVQLRSVNVTSNGNNGNASNGSNNGDKTPTTPSKLMINHGKPNFTIQRSPKAQENGEENPFANGLQANKNNNYNPYKKAEGQSYKNNNNNVVISTKFNGAFKPANVPLTQKQPHQTNGGGGDVVDNEASTVVLRRPKLAEPPMKEGEDDAVPEFIRRQRRIQERLAKENVLDFESRRSGYFTHVVISPTSPNRQSFVETMSSPAIVPALELPPPTPKSPPPQQLAMPTTLEVNTEEEEEQTQLQTPTQQQQQEIPASTNGHHIEAEEEEEVAKAIEEVNKAVAGEDDEKPIEQVQEVQPTVVAADESQLSTTTQQTEPESDLSSSVIPERSSWHPIEATAVVQTHNIETTVEEPIIAAAAAAATMAHLSHEEDTKTQLQQNGHIEVVEVHAAPKENGHNNDITISHTNGFEGPSIPAPDPSGALGVNYEPKTVVSFSKDLGSEPNKYPDTVKVVTDNGDAKTPVDEELQEIAKLKFDIKTDEQDVQVTPVLRAD